MQKENFLGVDVSNLSYSEILSSLKERMDQNLKSTIIAVNPEKIITANKDPQLLELINNSTYQIPDGVGVLLASKLVKGKVNSRVTGVDMMDHLLRFSAENGYRVFLYGAKEEVVSEAKRKIEKKYPSIIIAGYANGYVKDNEALVNRINEVQADVLFVAMGSPKQELWIREHMDKLNAKVYQGVGGSFDVFSGYVKRAPAVFRKFGLEWLYRLLSQPSRFKRQLALPKFLIKVLLKR
jgi:N-acetylglucosaminyldiphosphoundecaprenol N-acetyl-beta-D-mannosaminyltransferase